MGTAVVVGRSMWSSRDGTMKRTVIMPNTICPCSTVGDEGLSGEGGGRESWLTKITSRDSMISDSYPINPLLPSCPTSAGIPLPFLHSLPSEAYLHTGTVLLPTSKNVNLLIVISLKSSIETLTQRKPASQPHNPIANEMEELKSRTDYSKAMMPDGLAVLEGTTTWCPQCKAIAPTVDKLMKKYPDARFYQVGTKPPPIDKCLKF